jgi:hypothetical protein
VNDVVLTPSKADSFKKNLADLRNKRVLAMETATTDAIRFQNVTLQKSGEDWALKTPIATKADSSEVATLLSAVQFTKALGFSDGIDLKQAGLDPPTMRLSIHDEKTNSENVLLIGKESESGKYYAKDRARPSVFIVDGQIVDKLRRPVFDWRDKTVVLLSETRFRKSRSRAALISFHSRRLMRTGSCPTAANYNGQGFQFDERAGVRESERHRGYAKGSRRIRF